MIKSIETYIINLKRRTDRRVYILQEFENRKEFNIHVINAIENRIGSIGLLDSIKYILIELVCREDEFIILCEDDHQFTKDYSKKVLFNCIKEAKDRNADI